MPDFKIDRGWKEDEKCEEEEDLEKEDLKEEEEPEPEDNSFRFEMPETRMNFDFPQGAFSESIGSYFSSIPNINIDNKQSGKMLIGIGAITLGVGLYLYYKKS